MNNDPRDTGLELFLHLLEPKLGLPQAAVEPQEIRLRLDKGEKKEISLRIFNKGRGYLSGTIELSEKMPGIELSADRFALDSKKGETGRDVNVRLHLDTEQLEAGKEYRTSLAILTNGQPEKLFVPVSILAADRKKRVSEVTSHILSYGMLPLFIYWLALFDWALIMHGYNSPFRGADNLITIDTVVNVFEVHALHMAIFIGLLAAICLPLILLVSGRRPGWFIWFLFAGSLAYLFYRSESDPAIFGFYGTIVLMTLIPLFITMSLTRLLYYRSPHLPGIPALAITAAVFTVFVGGQQLALVVGQQLVLPVSPQVAPHIAREVKAELILYAQDNEGATFYLLGAEQKEIHIAFTDRCWARIRQDDEHIAERTFLPGEEIRLGDAVKTKIRLGFPEGAVIKVNEFMINDNIFEMAGPINLTIIKQK